MSDEKMTHLDASGKAHMVDVGAKPISRRQAVATACVQLNSLAADAIRANSVRKGDVLGVARLAGIGGAKRTDELIPLCHSVPLDSVDIQFEWLTETCLQLTSTSAATGRTGVEMEAMVACSCAALAIYDMCKSLDKSITIQQIQLVSKSGGVRGDYTRPAAGP